MENYIKNTDLINAYINKTLSGNERLAFENRLETDLEFKELYNQQLAIIEGINRTALKTEIIAAKQGYIRAKWMRIIGVSVGVILVFALGFSLFFQTERLQVSETNNTNQTETIKDSVIVKMPSEEKIVPSKISKDTKALEDIIEKQDEIVTSQKATRNSDNAEEVTSEEKIILKTEETQQTIKSKPISPELISFFKSIKKQPQIIEVNTEKKFTVTCKEGTVLTIPAKSFVDIKTGKLARGKINLEVTEYYKLSDMLLANLTTKADDEQLETGGMIYLDANKKGKKLKLKSGRRIQMAFNNKGKKDMQLFVGEEDNNGVNWKLEGQVNYVPQIKKTKPVIEIFEDVKVDFSVIEEVPVFQKCKENKGNGVRRYCMENEILKFVQNKFNTSIAENLELTGAYDINTYFEIEKDGTIGEIKIRTSRKELGDEMIRVIESMPKFMSGKQKGRAVKTIYYLPFEVLFKGETVKQLPITVVNKKFINKINKRLDSTSLSGEPNLVRTREFERYVFGSTKLGWINCDRFVRSKKQKVKYKLKIKDSEGANVKMIFKSISSILPSTYNHGGFDFRMIPKDEEVIIIAIKKTNAKLFLAKKETTTKANPKLNLDFKEVTVQELVNELKVLNKSF